MSKSPVCCTLGDAEQRRRAADLDDGLAKKIAGVRELEDGYALRFEPQAGIVEELARFIDFERACCRFLDFGLRVEKDDGPIWLDLRGSAEGKVFLRQLVERWTS